MYAGGTAAGVLLSQMLRRAGREVRLGRAADRDVSDRADAEEKPHADTDHTHPDQLIVP